MLKNLSTIVRLLARLVQLIAHIINHPDLDGIIRKFVKAMDLFIGLMEERAQADKEACSSTGTEQQVFFKPFRDLKGQVYSLAEVMPQKTACRNLGISDSKMKLMRKADEFTVLKRKGDDGLVRPQVWLLRTEVEAKRLSYSIPKGKV